MKAFYAYPSSEKEVNDAINSAQSILKKSKPLLDLCLWTQNNICGLPLTDPIFENIKASDLVIADITTLNFNVTFEIGYAIGLNKCILLTKNNNIKHDTNSMDKIGVFDTLGYKSYVNGNELAEFLANQDSGCSIPMRQLLNTKAPVYVLRTPQSNDTMLTILSRIKKSRLGFRGFIPDDEPRLSAPKAIDDISTSIGIVVPLLPSRFADAEVHNIRAAFIAGLALGMDKPTVILQPRDGPAPLDVRDIVSTYDRPEDITDILGNFALEVTAKMQEGDPLPLPKGNFLAELQLGDSVAENEFSTLYEYYLRTDQFHRASRGEANLVVGRKGAGKTALFSQVRDSKRVNKDNIVVDLKPEGYQLIRLKEDVLDYLAEGAKTHLITALFEYVFYLEICYKILEKDASRHLRDNKLYQSYVELQEQYYSGDVSEGDFSERLVGVAQTLINTFKTKYGQEETDQRLTATQITELLYKHNIREIKAKLSDYLKFKNSTWLLFDNLDKGWSSHGLSQDDILILRGLIDAARKIQHQMQREKHDFYSLVFVRNDVYQLLVETSADYGKENRVTLDWTDSDLLREVIRRRLISNFETDDITFEKMWNEICISHYKGEDTSQFLIDHSLMRPRNLIKLIGHCRGYAVSMGRTKIEESDIEKGLKAYSLDLVTEADQELTDIIGSDTNLIFHFIGEGKEFNRVGLCKILEGASIAENRHNDVIRFMIYYGFLGVYVENNVKYIFDVGYDMKLMDVLLQKAGNESMFILSPAFDAALNL